MISQIDSCILCGTTSVVDCAMRCISCATTGFSNDSGSVIPVTPLISEPVSTLGTVPKLKLDVKMHGALNDVKRTLRVTVPDNLALRHEIHATNQLYVEFTVGRYTPTIRWANAPTGLGIELTIIDATLMSAAEDAAIEHIRNNDRAFFERYFESK